MENHQEKQNPTILALQQSREKLDLNILAAAFEKYVQTDKPGKVNPFISDEFEVETLETLQPTLEVGATNNRLRLSSKTLKASEILKAQ